MEPNYIKGEASTLKAFAMANQLELSPVDRHKAKFGEEDQANYLLMAKGDSAEKKSPKKRSDKTEEIYGESPTKQSQEARDYDKLMKY